MTRKEAAKLVAFAAANFPSMQERDLGPTAELWHTMLQDLDVVIAQNAVAKILSTAKFWPSVAEIREAAASLSAPAIPDAAEAWEEVLYTIRKVGYYGDPRWSHPLIARAVDAFGWQDLCMHNIDDTPTVRAQYLRIYETYAKRQREDAVLPPAIRDMARRAVQDLEQRRIAQSLALPEGGGDGS